MDKIAYIENVSIFLLVSFYLVNFVQETGAVEKNETRPAKHADYKSVAKHIVLDSEKICFTRQNHRF